MIFGQPSSRQELYDRIRQSSKDEVILEEMIRLGFWPAEGTLPQDPAEEIRRRGELERKLQALRTETSRLADIAALERETRRRRLEESRRKQRETKERRERERQERALGWARKKEQDIVYLGEGVSGGLNETDGDLDRIATYGLPVLCSAEDIAKAMGISVGELRFLAFRRKVSKTTHYVRFKIPKRTGGEREISAPLPRLKRAQRWVLDNVLSKLSLDDAAHGFRPDHSIVSNADPHVGAEVVVNVDLRDFFPSVTYRRVKGLFRKLGLAEAAATILALLTTAPDTLAVELDGQTYHVAVSEPRLPQGAPTSPAITNILCRRLDCRLKGIAKQLGFRYTRYADDLTFSASGPAAAKVGKLLRRVSWVVDAEGFAVHPDKTRVLRQGRRQEVTGLVVNRRRAVPRAVLRRFRATLHQIEKDGPEGKRWGPSGDVMASIFGFASFVAMVEPAKGAALLERVRAIHDRHGYRRRGPVRQPRSAKEKPTEASAEAPSEPPEKKKWWKFW